MKIKSGIITLFILSLFAMPAPVKNADATYPSVGMERLNSIDGLVEKSIREGKTPGAVVLIGHRGEIVYRKAFGRRSVQPDTTPMTTDTVFDIASLTKVVATTTAIMQLAEKGKLDIDAPVTRYWPDFGENGKKKITVRQLLTHYSGLRADLDLSPIWSGYAKAMAMVLKEKPVCRPGSCFLYSDINFLALGELVRRVSGKQIDVYTEQHIFSLLGMRDTGYRLPRKTRERIAPTVYRKGEWLCGKAHDPTCYFMGGVAGHAGLFSTADDLALFAQMLLNGGELNSVRILNPSSVQRMGVPQSPGQGETMRGFGWSLEAPFANDRDRLAPLGAFGHLGYTGTALWVDPVSQTYVIVLANRVHPDGRGDVTELRTGVKKIVSSSLGPLTPEEIITAIPLLGDHYEFMQEYLRRTASGDRPMTGMDRLREEKFSLLKDLRIGLITNQTGKDSSGTRSVDLFRNAAHVKLKAIFSPEHGLQGISDTEVSSTTDALTGLPVYSLYGKVKRPTRKMLDGLDALVFDMQDAGVRFYTYITTMAYAMEAAAAKGIPLYVLDRPNPLNGLYVQGPVMDTALRSFTGYFPLPLRHGMTVGELALLFNAENHIGADVYVIKMRNYDRRQWYDETGLAWTNPSPNIRSMTALILYPGIALTEGANVSVGRGTETPFSLLGAPWIRKEELCRVLNERNIPGVTFMPVEFTPKDSIYKERLCRGVFIDLVDRSAFDPAILGINLIDVLYRLHPAEYEIDKTLHLVGSRSVLHSIKEGKEIRDIAMEWQPSLDKFRKLREKYLLY